MRQAFSCHSYALEFTYRIGVNFVFGIGLGNCRSRKRKQSEKELEKKARESNEGNWELRSLRKRAREPERIPVPYTKKSVFSPFLIKNTTAENLTVLNAVKIMWLAAVLDAGMFQQ